jgi:pilus assembly protein FimV
LPRLLLTGALLSPVTLYALGLGEIRLNSALNQPFDAEIELIAPTADELASLKVGLASNELFSRYGLDRPSYLSNFDFSISRSRDGRASIKVRSNRSVTEPFVTLLVEASWARGRLLREYTVLLDPPVFMPSQSQAQSQPPVSTPQSGARTEGRIERPQPEAQPETQPQPEPQRAVETETAPRTQEPVAAATPAQVGGEYAVERNDTLWSIASRVNPGSPSVINRTMIALFRNNPDAFNGNINRLRAGSVLRVPDVAEIEAITAGEAASEVARQTAEWAGAAAPTQTADDASRLRLVTPEEEQTAPAQSAQAAPEQAPGSPQGAPGGTPSQPDKRLEITSPELATAQQNTQEAPVEPAASEQPPAAETTPPAEAETPEIAAEEPATPAVRQQPRPAQTPEPASPSLSERIGDFWWVFVVLGLLVVIALVGVFVRRRREADAAGSLDTLAPLSFEPPSRRAPPPRKDRADSFVVESEPTAAVDDDLLDEPAPAPITARRSEPAAARSIEPAVAAAPTVRSVEDTLSSETAVRLDQQDALAEADFHMAYGLYDQAADLVKIAIERESSRRDLKLKLLEIYFVWGNRDLFLETARELYNTRTQAPAGEWDKVLIMGKQIAPDEPMFKGEASGGLDLVDVNLEGGENRVDVDLFAEPEGEQPAGLDLEFTSGERKAPAATNNDSDLDFLLDEPKRGADEEPTRELDPLARTQETPTIESPMLDRTSATMREKLDRSALARSNAEQTAELSIDDLGLDVNSLESTGSLEDTTSLERDAGETAQINPPLRDDELTQLAPSLGSLDRTMEAPRPQKAKSATSDTGRFDIEQTGTIFIDQVDLTGGDTVEQPRPDVDATAAMKTPSALDVDLDFDHLSGADSRDVQQTVRQARPGDAEADDFSSDVFADRTAETPRIDLDVGESLAADDHEPTNKQSTHEMELSELEPVTMSEVGTKLDLARAYMDMGDPDGARSILEEVLSEGNPNQKQEAQRLMESIR